MDETVSKIIESYNTIGITNSAAGVHYPPKQWVERVLERIKEVLFPGFFGTQALEDTDLVSLTKNRVYALDAQLRSELYKCLLWDPNEEAAPITEQDALARSEWISEGFFAEIPTLRHQLLLDAKAIFSGDPAANSVVEVLLSYPGFQAVMIYRIAHYFYKHDVPLLPRMLTESAHVQTGVDIHPGARIGASFCIDHGSGVVIGETAVIGDRVSLYQGVTLGAFSVKNSARNKKRHPTLENGVTIYAMSTILGGDTIVGEGTVVGGNVWLTHSIPAGSKIFMSEETTNSYRIIKGNSTV